MYVRVYIHMRTYAYVSQVHNVFLIKVMLLCFEFQDKLSSSWNRMEVTIGKRINNIIIPDLRDLQKVFSTVFQLVIYFEVCIYHLQKNHLVRRSLS
jgi:hypothetical protein